MDSIIVIDDSVAADGTRRYHAMSNTPIPDPSISSGIVTQEAGVYHLRAEWRARGAFCGTVRGDDIRERPTVLWAIEAGQRLSDEARSAAREFCRSFGRWPTVAGVRRMPKAVAELMDVDIEIEDGVAPLALVECVDVPVGFVMVF